MPGPGTKPLDDEIRRARQGFYAGLAKDAKQTADRLESAYQSHLAEINRAIREFEARSGGRSDRMLAGLINLQERLTVELDDLQGAITDVTWLMQDSGAAAGYRAGLRALERAGMTVAFSVPTQEAIQAAINYVDSPAWRQAVGSLAGHHAQTVADRVLSAAAMGTNPRQTAAWIRSYFVHSRAPLQDALRMARTTQNYAAREAHRQIYERTGVEFWIWSANLGNPRTCMACIVMHGTRHPTSEILNDHHNGRCGPAPVTPRWAELGLAGGELEIETGIDWFKRQSADDQRRMMGPKFWDAWTAGKFRLQDIPKTYDNPIFGPMRRKATLGELLRGDGGDGLISAPEPLQPTPAGGAGGAAVKLDLYEIDNRRSYIRAQAITPDALEAGEAPGTLGEYMYNFFAYDNQGNAIFDPEQIAAGHSDLLFDVWSLGKGRLDQRHIDQIRERAGALLAADDWAGKNLTRAERNALARLASADDETAIAQIDKIRDKRMKGVIGYSAPTYGAGPGRGGVGQPAFMGAAEQDARDRLMEFRQNQQGGY